MRAKIPLFGAAVVAGALLMPALAAAQAPPDVNDRVAPKEKLSGPKDCVRTRATTGEGVDIKTPEGRPLSEQLADAQGVICPPPDTDPEMKKPAPGGGVTPVIPPPGSDKDHLGVEPR